MIRETVVEEVSKILHGPMGGPGEELEKNPLDFYTVGILFPQIINGQELTDSYPDNLQSNLSDEVGDANENNVAENEIENQVEKSSMQEKRAALENDESADSGEFELTTMFRPSAAGLSILAKKKSAFSVTVKFANYKKKLIEKNTVVNGEAKIEKIYVFKQLEQEFVFESKDGNFDFNGLKYDGEGNVIYVTLDDNSSLSIITRVYPRNNELEIKTFTLINSKEVSSFKQQKKTEDCLYQPVITILMKEGFNAFEDLTDLSLLSTEDLNLKLLYRHYKKYALGHGISVNWIKSENIVHQVFTEVLPQEKVNGVDLNPPIFQPKDILYMKRLGGSKLTTHTWDHIKNELFEFIDLYSSWIEEQHNYIFQNSENLAQEFIKQAKENLKHCLALSERMKKGVTLLNGDLNARKAFEDANRAMFMQRVMADFSKHRRNENRVQHDTSQFDDPLPDYSKIPFNSSSEIIWKNGTLCLVQDIDKNGSLARWRPFQLAFLLSQIEGIIDPSSVDRDTVDLIWFPTGGGKTEAYLGLTAFTIFYRRLMAKKVLSNPDLGAGVTVLMRNTLRL